MPFYAYTETLRNLYDGKRVTDPAWSFAVLPRLLALRPSER
ncbi:hypothetical protein ACPOL_6255 [Acidisarcina polymorpha]|uniref:Uncharacterized protein n=1 Tax=Acidisarcina polymorpha TaxID=2211140 RepID=A0A2Z5GA83_9BACT|nr:hypothetical protein ACPOL_6255 [Acidisarcina polymorpha]